MASRSSWDTKYRLASRSAAGPDPFLAEAERFFPSRRTEPARAADIASGDGRHALRLARLGFATLAVDFSLEGLRLCRARAAATRSPVEALCLDLETPGAALANDRFDVLTVFDYLHRPLIPALKRSLRPGGIMVYKTFTVRQRARSDGPRNPAYLLRENELRELFADFKVLLYRESSRGAAKAALVAQRP